MNHYPIDEPRQTTIITGRIMSSDGSFRHLPVFLVRACISDTDTVVSQTISTSRGEFILTVQFASAVTLSVEALDGDRNTVAQRTISLTPQEEPVVILSAASDTLTGAKPAKPDSPPARLVIADSLLVLRSSVSRLAEQGVLDAEASNTLENAIRPLEWLDDLLDDARRVLTGDFNAAKRLRMALLGLGVGAESSTASELAVDDGGSVRGKQIPDIRRVIRPEPLAELTVAAVRAASNQTEAQSILNGLTTVLWSRLWLELVLCAMHSGDTAAVRPLMTGPVPGWTPVPDPRTGKPPSGPGGGVPVRVDVPEPYLDKPPPGPGSLMPDLFYVIETIDKPGACEGELITLTGTDFGKLGSVVFPGKGGGVSTTNTPLWSDTKIRVYVPAGATPGEIRLVIFDGFVIYHGVVLGIHRLGTTIPDFLGGIPAIHEFTVNGQSSEVVAEPESTLTIRFRTSESGVIKGPMPGIILVRASIFVLDGSSGAIIFSRFDLLGGLHTLTFSAPAATEPRKLVVTLAVANHCDRIEESISILLVKQPKLHILKVEVTQAIQRLDNSVRLAAGRQTVVRVYLGTGLEHFTFVPEKYSALPGISGTLTIWKLPTVAGMFGTKEAELSPIESPFTAFATGWPNYRNSLSSSLNFSIPGTRIPIGECQLDVRVFLSHPPRGVSRPTTDSRSLTLTFEGGRGLTLWRILIADTFRGLPAPTYKEWQEAFTAARSRFPIADYNWTVLSPPGFDIIWVNRDLSTEEGWEDLLEDLDDVAFEFPDVVHRDRWVGFVSGHRPPPLDQDITQTGLGRHPSPLRPRAPRDALVMAAMASDIEALAHELGHTLDFYHAACGDVEKVDESLPGFIEDYGVDVMNMEVFLPFVSGELMSYCYPSWPSIVTWHRLMDHNHIKL